MKQLITDLALLVVFGCFVIIVAASLPPGVILWVADHLPSGIVPLLFQLVALARSLMASKSGGLVFTVGFVGLGYFVFFHSWRRGKRAWSLGQVATVRTPSFPAYSTPTASSVGGVRLSPIEEAFWEAWQASCSIPLIPQYKIGKYRVDFAHEPSMTIIELDGFRAHSSTDSIAHDRRRQREIEALGWHFIRFGGKEIKQNLQTCVEEAEQGIRKRIHSNLYQQW
ncbi:MAG: endonuclease domain-containing protein [Ktedonobacteraceae bacterium]